MARGWWREYFYDHPRSTERPIPNEVFAVVTEKTTDKPKVWCMRCFDQLVTQLQSVDVRLVELRERAAVRDIEEIRHFLWYSYDGPSSWISSKADTCRHHLRDCFLQPPNIRAQAGQLSPQAQRRTHYEAGLETNDHFIRPLTLTSHSIAPLTLASQSIPSIIHSPSPWPPSTSAAGSHSIPSVVRSPSPWPPSAFAAGSHSIPSIVRSPSPWPPSASATGSSAGSSAGSITSHLSVSRKRARLSPLPDAQYGIIRQFSEEDQKRFEVRLARVTASSTFPAVWVDNPEVHALVDEFIPGAKVPSSKVLTQRIIPAEVNVWRDEVKARVSGHNATASYDGWTGINAHHIIAFMVTTCSEVHPVKVIDTTGESKTADKLLMHMLDVIRLLETEWNVKVVAFCSDASGESRKARVDLLKQRPDLVTPDCYAHQINLIVGDYFKAHADFIKFSKDAIELITWLRSKTQVLAKLQEIQKEYYGRTLSIIRPVITRWTAHYLAYARLLDTKVALAALVLKDETKAVSELVKGDKTAKGKAQSAIKIIQSNDFWASITRMKSHLEPLAIAANITQSSTTHLGQVLLTFGLLYRSFSNLDKEEDAAIIEAVLGSIDRRWKKSDQDVFVAALILNPVYQTRPFCRTPTFTPAALHELFARLWARFFKDPIPVTFFQEVTEYFNKRGAFSSMTSYVDRALKEAQRTGTPLHPTTIWSNLTHVEDPIPLARLALHLHAICPNSASCERLFSVFGNTLTKLRNRLGLTTLQNLAELKMHLRLSHAKSGLIKQRLKRQFGPPRAPLTEQGTATAPPADPLSRLDDADIELTYTADVTDAEASDPQQLVAGMVELLHDDEDREPPRFPSNLSMTMKEIFDFSLPFWADVTFGSAEICKMN